MIQCVRILDIWYWWCWVLSVADRWYDITWTKQHQKWHFYTFLLISNTFQNFRISISVNQKVLDKRRLLHHILNFERKKNSGFNAAFTSKVFVPYYCFRRLWKCPSHLKTNILWTFYIPLGFLLLIPGTISGNGANVAFIMQTKQHFLTKI